MAADTTSTSVPVKLIAAKYERLVSQNENSFAIQQNRPNDVYFLQSVEFTQNLPKSGLQQRIDWQPEHSERILCQTLSDHYFQRHNKRCDEIYNHNLTTENTLSPLNSSGDVLLAETTLESSDCQSFKTFSANNHQSQLTKRNNCVHSQTFASNEHDVALPVNIFHSSESEYDYENESNVNIEPHIETQLYCDHNKRKKKCSCCVLWATVSCSYPCICPTFNERQLNACNSIYSANSMCVNSSLYCSCVTVPKRSGSCSASADPNFRHSIYSRNRNEKCEKHKALFSCPTLPSKDLKLYSPLCASTVNYNENGPRNVFECLVRSSISELTSVPLFNNGLKLHYSYGDFLLENSAKLLHCEQQFKEDCWEQIISALQRITCDVIQFKDSSRLLNRFLQLYQHSIPNNNTVNGYTRDDLEYVVLDCECQGMSFFSERSPRADYDSLRCKLESSKSPNNHTLGSLTHKSSFDSITSTGNDVSHYPSYVTLRRRDIYRHRPELKTCTQSGDSTINSHELQKIREIIAGIDSSKYQKRSGSRRRAASVDSLNRQGRESSRLVPSSPFLTNIKSATLERPPKLLERTTFERSVSGSHVKSDLFSNQAECQYSMLKQLTDKIAKQDHSQLYVPSRLLSVKSQKEADLCNNRPDLRMDSEKSTDSRQKNDRKTEEYSENAAMQIRRRHYSRNISETQDTRTHVVGELYDTEKSYVEFLRTLVDKYMKPLKSPEYSGLVENNLVDEIFFKVPDILHHHEAFLEVLRQRVANWDSSHAIGDVFVDVFTKQPIIETYTAFINNWKTAKEAIKLAIQAKPAFAKFLEHMSREQKSKLTLDAILIMPVQRIPRYELLIKELVKHTPTDHCDHEFLLRAQKEVHELALKINRMEEETFLQEQMQQKVKEIEHLIEGVMDVSQLNSNFSPKRGSPSPFNTLEGNKYKYLMRFPLDNIDIAKATDINVKKTLKDIETLQNDLSTLNQITELVNNLAINHQPLDDAIRDVLSSVSKQLNDKQSNDSQLLSLELSITSQEGVDNLTVIFPNTEKRSSWESAFNEAKQKLALSTDRKPPPEFIFSLPIRKTRAGLQFTCASPTLGLNQFGYKDVWICNSDGYVGQVCVLSMQPDPNVTSCNGVCNARILCVTAIPGVLSSSRSSSRRKSIAEKVLSVEEHSCFPNTTPLTSSGSTVNTSTSQLVSPSPSVASTPPPPPPPPPPNLRTTSLCPLDTSRSPTPRKTKSLPPLSAPSSQFQLDSDSSDDDEEDPYDEEVSLSIPPLSPVDSCCSSEFECNHPTMWLGTEDGCIHVYNCYDNIRIKKNKVKIQLTAAVNCIIYLNNQVFGGLSNGQIAIFKRDETGNWITNEPKIIEISTNPVVKLLAVSGKLWCAVQNQVSVLATYTLETEISFQVNIDTNRVILCMVASGLGVWISTQSSPIIKLYHGKSYECLLEVNIAPAVSKILATACDDIIRQHKAACLRVTTLLTCKDLLWIGTSAGTVLTMPLPHLTAGTTKVENVPTISGIPQGHTGHVRFLTTVQFNCNTPCLRHNPNECNSNCHSMKKERFSVTGKQLEEQSIIRSGSNPSLSSKILVISGGDGYEDFANYGNNESVGRDDSTNHILLWQV